MAFCKKKPAEPANAAEAVETPVEAVPEPKKSRFSPTLKGALVGAVAGSVLPVLGTVSGAIVGGIAGKLYGKKQRQSSS